MEDIYKGTEVSVGTAEAIRKYVTNKQKIKL